jgi:ribosomal protein L29
MKKADKISYRQKTIPELRKSLLDLHKQFIEAKSKHVSGSQKDTSVFKKIRYEISLATTILNEKTNEESKK